MIKKLFILFTVLFVMSVSLIPCCAGEMTEDDLYLQSGADEVFSSLDEETLSLLESVGIDISDPSSVMNISVNNIISSALGVFTGKFAEPIKKCSIIMGAVILFALIDSVAPAAGKANETGGMIFMFMLSFMVIAPVCKCIENVLSVIMLTSNFTKGLIPVMTGFIAASGKPLQSAAFSSVCLGICEIISYAVDKLFIPLTGAYAAVCIVASVNPLFNLQNIALFFRKVFTVVLGFVAAVFTGVITIKGAAASSADSIALKGVKFLVGGLVPVVGGAVSEGLATVGNAFSYVNKTVGIIGIIGIIFSVLPAVFEVLIWWACLYICSLGATLTGQTQVAFYLSGVSNVIVMLNILLIFDAFVFLTALGQVVAFGGGGA